jgi:hypothetical protein
LLRQDQGEKIKMKKYVLALALFALSFSAFAAPTDYEVDSKYQGAHSTPFKPGQSLALSPFLAYQLRAILLQCVVEVQGAKDGYTVVYGPKILPACSQVIKSTFDSKTFSDLAWVNVYGTSIWAKTFDGIHSNGGTQFDVAVYDALGKRIGLRTEIYSAGSALTGLAALAGIKQFYAMPKQYFDMLPKGL